MLSEIQIIYDNRHAYRRRARAQLCHHPSKRWLIRECQSRHHFLGAVGLLGASPSRTKMMWRRRNSFVMRTVFSQVFTPPQPIPMLCLLVRRGDLTTFGDCTRETANLRTTGQLRTTTENWHMLPRGGICSSKMVVRRREAVHMRTFVQSTLELYGMAHFM